MSINGIIWHLLLTNADTSVDYQKVYNWHKSAFQRQQNNEEEIKFKVWPLHYIFFCCVALCYTFVGGRKQYFTHPFDILLPDLQLLSPVKLVTWKCRHHPSSLTASRNLVQFMFFFVKKRKACPDWLNDCDSWQSSLVSLQADHWWTQCATSVSSWMLDESYSKCGSCSSSSSSPFRQPSLRNELIILAASNSTS